MVFSKKKKLRKTKCSCEGYGFRLGCFVRKHRFIVSASGKQRQLSHFRALKRSANKKKL